MTIFDYLKTIVVSKTLIQQLETYVPYLITRWLSFINPSVCQILNSVNKQVLLENKDLHYKVMLSLFPKISKMPRISYIKKVKFKEEQECPKIKVLAQQLELSTREVQSLLTMQS